jgi:thioesterase domain-containing protein
LTGLLGLSPASFYRLEDNAKLSLAQQIYNLAEAQAPALVDYGLDAASIAAMHTAIEEYQAQIARPMGAIGIRKQKTTDLKHLFARLDSTLYDRLDKLMALFKDSHPDFYGEYRTARNYIDTSGRHKKTEEK